MKWLRFLYTHTQNHFLIDDKMNYDFTYWKFKETCEETNKSDNLQKVEDFQLSWKTIAHRLEDLSNNIKDQFIRNWKFARIFSPAFNGLGNLRDSYLLINIWVYVVSNLQQMSTPGPKYGTCGIVFNLSYTFI